MYAPFDDKGKIFTQVVSKKPVSVVIQTNHHRIEGKIHVRPDLRLKDELDGSNLFIAVTEAMIYDLNGQLVLQPPFLVVQSAQIVWLAPNDEN